MKYLYLFLFLFLAPTLSSFANGLEKDSISPVADGTPMSGLYTVNPAQPASATNFTSLVNAINALNSDGISGAVTISIYNGNHTGGIVSNVAGVSATNTITFTSFSNDSLQVKIPSLEFSNTSFVTVRKLWVDALKFSGNSSNAVVKGNSLKKFFWLAADHVLVEGNYVVGGMRLEKGTAPGELINDIVVRNNHIKNGTADDNGFNYFMVWGFVNKPLFENNLVEDVNISQTGYSLIGCCTYVPYEYGGFMEFKSCRDTAIIRNNKFLRSSTKRFVVNSATPTEGPKLTHLMIYNNFISTAGEVTMNGENASFFFNNFHSYSTNFSGGFTFAQASASNLYNNNFYSSNGGVAVTYGVNAVVSNSDYNNYFTTGPVLIVKQNNGNNASNYADLQSWKSATGKDLHSISVNPKYMSNDDLHPKHPALVAAGTPFPAWNPILKDIDGDNRNQLNPCIGADEFNAISADVSIEEYKGPIKNFSSTDPLPIVVRLKNNGAALLTTVKVRWIANGVEQTSVWNGSLPYDSAVDFTVASYNFEMLKFTNLKIWTELPNGAPDMNPVNDTVQVDSIIPYAQGSFTLGGDNPNIPNFSTASMLLNKGGVNGPVTIQVRNGKYTENVVFKHVPGSSNTNTITIKGESNNALLDTLTFNSSTAPTLRLDSASYFVFKHITFQTEGIFARAIAFANKSHDITIDNCVFYAKADKSSYPHIDVENQYTSGIPSLDSNVVITNNRFSGGGSGVRLIVRNAEVSRNSFTNMYSNNSDDLMIKLYGYYPTSTNKMVVDSNFIENNPVCSYLYNGVCYSYTTNSIGGIYISMVASENDISIMNNRIRTYGRNGIYFNATGTASMPIKVYNNMIKSVNGLSLSLNGSYIHTYNNSLNDSSSFSSSVTLNGSNQIFKNNLLVKSTVSTYAPLNLIGNTAPTLDCSNNAFYNADTSVKINGFVNLSVNPFVSINDMHINKNLSSAIQLYKEAEFVSYITKDIDGEMRKTPNPCIGADEFDINNDDAGISNILGFKDPISNGPKDIFVDLKNYGKNNLTAATIHWKVNDDVQPDYQWTGNLSTGDTAKSIKIGTYDFNQSIVYKISVWSSSSGDSNTLNDSTNLNFIKPSMCGTYTVGGTTPNYASFSELSSYINTAGVSCPVTILVRDGEYAGQVAFENIPGLSATNTLTIQSESLDSSKVIISAPVNSGSQVLLLNNVSYLNFKNVTIRRSSNPTMFYFDVVKVTGNAHHITFQNCELSTPGPGILFAGNTFTKPSDFTLTQNKFIGGKAGIILNGGSSDPIKNVVISKNQFLSPAGDQYNSSNYIIDLRYAGTAKIENNFIDSATAKGYIGGITVSNTNAKVDIINNTILKIKGGIGINVQSSAGLAFADSAFLIANNFISLDSTLDVKGINATNIGQNMKIVYNNIFNNSSHTNSIGIGITTNGTVNTFKDSVINNNVVKNKAGYALNAQFSGAELHFRNNNFFVTGNAKVAKYNYVDYTTVASLPTTNGNHANSLSIDPLYVSATNLHITETALKNAGTPLPYVLKDIDGDVRGTTTTTIGADELVLKAENIGIELMTAPVVPFAVGLQPVIVSLKNYGTATITTAKVNWTLNGIAQPEFNFSGSLASETSTSITLGNINFTSDSIYNIKIWSSLPNGVEDGATYNDTLYKPNIVAALSGVYTIGASGADFKTFTQSQRALVFGGVLGDVTFKVKNGTYVETLQVDSIPFQNNFTITWESESGDSSLVILKNNASINTTFKGVVHLNHAKNIVFRKMTVQAAAPSSYNSFVSLIYFSNKNKNIRFESNRLIDSSGNAAATYGLTFVSNKNVEGSTAYINARSVDSMIVFDKNYLKQINSSIAPMIDLTGDVQTQYNGEVIVNAYLNNIQIKNNRFDVQLYSKPAIIATSIDSILISGNHINGSVNVDGTKYMVVDKNNIYHEGYNQISLKVIAGTGRQAGAPAIVSNNMIQSKIVGTYNGANVNNTVLYALGDRINILHNTLVARDTGSVTGYTAGSVLYLGGKYDTVKNNILYNVAGGTLVITNAVTNLTSNYNNYVYTNHFSSVANNLNEYRTKYGQDAQSVENILPFFKGERNLHASNILLKIAPPIMPSNNFILQDFDEETRGSTVCIGADEFIQPENDLIILSSTPSKVFSVGENEFKVKVYNNGSKPITSFKLSGKINNLRSAYSPVEVSSKDSVYAVNIAPMTEQIVSLGKMNVPLYQNELLITSSSLNGVGDEVTFTDTLKRSNFYAGLNGTYSFSQFSQLPDDFKSIQELKLQLELGGVYGPSIIKVSPGIIGNQLRVDSIPNRGDISPLTIESANGDMNTTGFKGSTSPLFMIYRANNLTIKNLSFENTNANSHNIILGWNSQKVTIENVSSKIPVTQGFSPTGTHIQIVGNYSGQSDFTDSNYTIRNNKFEGGGRGIEIAGNQYKGMSNMRVMNNTFLNQALGGISFQNMNDAFVDSNIIKTNFTDTSFIGIMGESIRKKIEFTRNKIFIEKDGFGISIQESYLVGSTTSDSLIITNNFITTGAQKASVNLLIKSPKKGSAFIYHNSSLNRSTSVNAVNLSFTTGPKSQVLNNIFYNKNAGRVLFLNKPTTATYLQHHNVVYTAGATFATVTSGTTKHYATLAALANDGIEYNSISGDPLFYSDEDLHLEGGLANNKGTYETYDLVKKDIDNEDRNNTTPDIGADEISLPDFGVVKLESPMSSCGHSATEVIKVWVKNFGTSARTNIPLGYRINGGSVVVDTLKQPVNAGDSVLFSFSQKANLLPVGNYYFDVFSNFRGDENYANDSIKKVLVATTPGNNQLPYYTGFEGTEAGWYTGGTNSSFKWGVIYSGIIDSAANGLNAWKTNLTGPYNNNELSYLYSPCFDFSALSSDPTINFNLAYQLENYVDKAWMEFSDDGGVTWKKLGAVGQGLGWYNAYGDYWTGNNKYWHNAKLTLSLSQFTNRVSVKFRFVMETNGTTVQDGLSIDDISIYTGANPPVSSGTYTNRTAVSTGTGNFIPVNDPSGNRILEINDNGQNLGNISVDVKQNNNGAPTYYNNNYYLGRNFVIKIQNAPTAPVTVRLFITQAEFNQWQSADPSIDQVRSIAVYKYSGSNEDFDLENNNAGTALIIQPFQINKIPYLDGYLLEFTVNSFSEFWITKGDNSTVPVQFVDVTAQLQNNKTLVSWKVENEQNVKEYEVLHSTNGVDWISVGVVSYHTGGQYNFVHASPLDGKNYYRVKQIDHDGKYMLSKIATVTKNNGVQIQIYPSPFKNVLRIQYSGQNGMVQLFSSDGRMVMKANLTQGMNVLNTSALTNGMYIYKIYAKDELIQVDKVVKE